MASFLDLFSVVDSDGTAVARYRLYFSGANLLRIDSGLFSVLTQAVFELFKLMVVPANALLGFVLNPGGWMTPLSTFYQKMTGPLFTLFPPWALACLGLAVVAVSTLSDHVKSTSKKMVERAILNRIGAAFGMVAVVIVFTQNPFALMFRLLDFVNSFSLEFATKISGGSTSSSSLAGTGTALVDNTIRIPTIALNYGNELSAACRSQWSDAMSSAIPLAESSGCFTPGANEAGVSSLGTALLMLLFPALPMLVFCAVAAWKYLWHLSASVFYLISTAWVAALAIFRRRNFDTLTRHFGQTAAHLAMAVVTSVMVTALPVLFSGLATDILGLVSSGQVRVFGLMVSLGVGFAASAWVLVRVTSLHGELARALHIGSDKSVKGWLGVDAGKESQRSSVGKFLTGPAGRSGQAGASSSRMPLRKGSALAADPIAATSAGDAAGADNRKGPSMGGDDSLAGGRAVTELTVAAGTVTSGASVGVAAAAASVAASTVAVGSSTPATAGVLASPLSTTLVIDATGADPCGTGNDPYGYYTPPVIATDDGDAGTSAGGGEPLRVETDSETVNPGGSAPGSEDVRVSPLADPPRPAVFGPDGNTPVAGNVYADPALDAAARAAGATFVTGPPTRRQRVTSWLRRFGRDESAAETDPAPGAFPEPIYAPPLSPATPPPVADSGEVIESTDPDDPVNDQQRFNRLRRFGPAARRLRDVTSSLTQKSAAAAAGRAGLRAGTNPHPSGFLAPMADELAVDALEAQMEAAQLIAAAHGTQADIVIDPDEIRIGIDLSSDPDERIRPKNTSGFGDPL